MLGIATVRGGQRPGRPSRIPSEACGDRVPQVIGKLAHSDRCRRRPDGPPHSPAHAYCGYRLRLRAALTPAVQVEIDFWAMESRAVGGRFVCQNTGDQPQTLGLGLAAQMAREGQTLQMFFLTLENNQVALQMGRLRNLQPILLVEDAIGTGASARLTRNLSLEPGQSVAVRWVLASTEDRDSSLLLAHQWLAQPSWDRDLEVIAARAETEPQIETGRAEWDAALAWSQQMVLRAFLAATGSLPHPSFVSSRKTNQGYAVSGVHPGGFNAPWGGQSIPEALLIAPTVALAAPDLAEGIVRNFIAVQRDDGWIDARPGLDGQRANVLAPPLLATLAYTVYEYTQRDGFLRDTFDGLLAFFRRWLQPDLDQDGDGLPEWSRPEQGAFGDSPTLARSRRWAQGANINTIEAPDLAAYLLREAASLIQIAQVLGDQGVADEVALRRDALREHLQAMWNPETGEQVVTSVLNREEAYPGAAMDQAPDLLISLREQNLVALDEIEEAIGVLTAALERNPNDASALWYLGTVHYRNGDPPRAYEYYSRCLDHNPDAVLCLSYLGGLQWLDGDYATAANNLQRAIELGSDDPDDFYQLGNSLASLGRCPDAIPYLRDGLSIAQANEDEARQQRFRDALNSCGAAG